MLGHHLHWAHLAALSRLGRAGVKLKHYVGDKLDIKKIIETYSVGPLFFILSFLAFDLYTTVQPSSAPILRMTAPNGFWPG